jgi:hypothetical protein
MKNDDRHVQTRAEYDVRAIAGNHRGQPSSPSPEGNGGAH